MANKRMFSKEIVNSDAFLDMPMSTQLLYFHLNMVADDDGFVSSPKSIMRMIGASEDDLRVLILKSFILSSDLWNGVVVVKHWRINNFMQKDRYKPTVYKDEKEMIELKPNGAYTWKKAEEAYLDCSVNGSLTQNRIDKNRIDKNRIGKNSIEEESPIIEDAFVGSAPTFEEVKLYCDEMNYTFDVEDFYHYYDEVNWTARDDRHSFNWKKKAKLWQDNQSKSRSDQKGQKVGVPDFMKEDFSKQEKKKPRKELLDMVNEKLERMNEEKG